MGSNLDFWTGGNSRQLSNILRLTRSRSGKYSGGTKRRIERATRAVRRSGRGDGTCASGMAS